MQRNSNKLTRRELRRLFKRHRGTAAQLARELDIKATSISHWLRGSYDSTRIDSAAQTKAADLLLREKQEETQQYATR